MINTSSLKMRSQLDPDVVFTEPDPGSRHQAAVFCNGKKAQTDTETEAVRQ